MAFIDKGLKLEKTSSMYSLLEKIDAFSTESEMLSA
jgi:hypothetical protein